MCPSAGGSSVVGYSTPPSSHEALPKSHSSGSPRLNTRTKLAAMMPMLLKASSERTNTKTAESAFIRPLD
jgi:hypothetical protein